MIVAFLNLLSITLKAMRGLMADNTIVLCFVLIFSILNTPSIAVDTITANQTIKDASNSSITSAGGIFVLGFFTPRLSTNRYLGIWYKIISTGTVVWVANRDTPLVDSSGALRLDGHGTLVLGNGTTGIMWSSNSSRSVISSPVVAQLLDNGNLVIRYENETDPEYYLWQSFDYLGDHILPGMKFGWDFVRGLDRHLTSWKSDSDPSPGKYSLRISLEGYPQVLEMEGNIVSGLRIGPWDGLKFSGMNFFKPNPMYRLRYLSNQLEVSYCYELGNNSSFMRIMLRPDAELSVLTWSDQNQIWDTYQSSELDDCDVYALCGAYSSCYLTKSQLGYVTCRCLDGYQPKLSADWNLANWSGGCVRQRPLDCVNGDIFVKYTGLKLPDTRQSRFNQSMDFQDCKVECLTNCSCTAFTTGTDIREGGMGCLLWFGDLIDIRDYGENGLNLYIRMASPKAEASKRLNGGKIRIICIVVILVVVALLLGLCSIHLFNIKKLARKGMVVQNVENDAKNENEREDLELPLFNFELIVNATNDFSCYRKLGEGGFGPVYKGILNDGQEIAVKRLSKRSQQGLDEFKNEVACISKLQHRNLVKLLGCCIEEGEMLLIYEYMPNKSLDSFIFNSELSKVLDWPKRYNIINGIAKGLLYLHQDSRLRIIHRDLKASNILLDYEMNPRISDFGLARTFEGNETAVNTVKVVGTCGYMPPEYVIDGLLSVKSDVYSFGVVVLEIVSGKKIRGLYHSDHQFNLLSHAWKLDKEGNVMQLINDGSIVNCNHFEVSRAVKVGLLCVQPYPKDRPSMSTVVSMLTSENKVPEPKEPGFFSEIQRGPNFSAMRKHGLSSYNELTVTNVAPR